jgi:hypothetical protein
MTALRALRPLHWLGIGAVVAVLAAGAPSKWFGLVSSKVTEVQRLRACMERHGGDLASLVTTLGDPQQIQSKTPAERRHAVHVAERRHELKRRQANAVVACARTVSG